MFYLDFGDLFLSVKNIYLKCVNVFVNNVLFLFVGIVFFLMNIEIIKLVMWLKNLRVKIMCYKMICKKKKNLFIFNIENVYFVF